MIVCDSQECDINDKIIIPNVLLLGSELYTAIGRPLIPNAIVFYFYFYRFILFVNNMLGKIK